jgi:hypothetical protein
MGLSCDSIISGLRNILGAAAYQNAAAVTPHDVNDLTVTASALYVGVAGDITVDMEGTGTQILFNAVPVGILRGRFTRVYATGTAATDIVALW